MNYNYLVKYIQYCVVIFLFMCFNLSDGYAQFKHGTFHPEEYKRETYTSYYFDTNYNYERSKSAAEIIWDFEDARIYAIDTFGNTFFNASDIYFSDLFPKANTVFYNEVYNSFDFFDKNENHLIKVGNITMYDTINRILSYFVNITPDTVYNYPICITPSYLSKVKRLQHDKRLNLWVSSIDSTLSEMETNGELKLPYGNFKNVYKKNYVTTQRGIVFDSNDTIIADIIVYISVNEWVQQFNAFPPLLSVCQKKVYFKARKQRGDFNLLSYGHYVRGFKKNDSSLTTISELKVSEFNNQTTVNYQLSTRQPHNVIVYDISGKQVDMQIVNTLLDIKDQYSVIFNTAGYAPGVYIFKVQNAREFASMKWIKK